MLEIEREGQMLENEREGQTLEIEREGQHTLNHSPARIRGSAW